MTLIERLLAQANKESNELADLLNEAAQALAQPKQEPAWWPAVENILNEYGLQAIDFVADFKAALAQPQQEPVAIHQWRKPMCCNWYDGHPDPSDGGGPYETRVLYTSPPAQQSPWCMKMNCCKTKCEDCPDEAPARKPLTDEEKLKIAKDVGVKVRTGAAAIKFANAIEAAHNIKENT